MTLPFSIPFAAMTAAFMLGACSSDKGKETSDSSSHDGHKKFSDRVNNKKNYQTTHRSSFEKQALVSRDSDLKSKSFHTKDYAGKTAADSVDKKFKSKEFSQADKKDTNFDKKETKFDKSFSGAGKTDKQGTKEFDTSKSKMADQTSHDAARTSHDASKSFTGSSKSYSTKSDPVTSKAANTALDKSSKNKKIDPSKPAYSEDEVRALLNKG